LLNRCGFLDTHTGAATINAEDFKELVPEGLGFLTL
jgi:hypothetical protein